MSDNKKEELGLPVADFNTILGIVRNDTKWVEIPEWNSRVKIKSLTKAEQVKLRKASTVRGAIDDTKLEQNLMMFSLVEPRLSFDQVDELYSKTDAKAISRLVASCLAFSGLTEDYLGEAEEDMKS